MKTSVKSSSLLLALLIALACLFGALLVSLPVVYAYLRFSQAYDSFPKRHVEVTRLIRSVYEHYSETDEWPEASSVTAMNSGAPLTDWEYHPATVERPPLLYLPGPYHMGLVYHFSAPMPNQLPNNRWMFACEGDKTYFNADVTYR